MNEQSLVTRVNRLERENRRMKLAGVLVLLGITAMMVMGQAGSGAQRTVTAKQFLLQDENGKDRGNFFALPDGTVALTLLDSKDKPRFALAVNPDGGTSLNIYGENKEQLALNPQAFRLIDSKGNPRMAAAVNSDGNPWLGIYGSKNDQIELGSDKIIFKKRQNRPR